MSESNDLKFGISLEPDISGFESVWSKQEKRIQDIIDKSKFTINVTSTTDLDKLESQLKRIQALQSASTKPLTAYRAGQLEIQREVALLNQKATATDKARREAALANNEEMRGVQIKANAEAAQIRLNNAQQKGLSVTNAQTNSYRIQAGVLTGLSQFLNQYISILGASRLVSNIKDITAEFELQRVSLNAITQDADFASSLFNKIKATAVESPFSVKDMITYTKQLAAYRIENEELYDTMNMLADVSAGLGVDMNRLILAYGQVKAASVLRGQELRQFTEAGIPMVEQLAINFSQLRNEVVSTSEVFDLISARQVPFAMVADIFKEMTSEGGKFYNMQEKQAESLYGIYENLKDNLQVAMDEIGQSNEGIIASVGKAATVIAKNLTTVVDLLGIAVMSYATYKVAIALASSSEAKLAASKVLVKKANDALLISEGSLSAVRTKALRTLASATAANNLYAKACAKAALANNVFAQSFWKVTAALAANPVAAIATGVVAVVAGATVAYKKYVDKLTSVDEAQKRVATLMKNTSDEQDKLNTKVKSYTDEVKRQDVLVRSANKSYSEFAKIWPELAKSYKNEEEYKAALNSANEKRVEAINNLKSAFPEYFSYLDSEKFKIEDLTQGYLNLENAQRASMRTRLTERKSELESLIAQNESTIRDINSSYQPSLYTSGNLYKVTASNKAELTLKGLNAELEEINKQLASLTDAETIAMDANVNWRTLYKKDVEPTLTDEALAQVALQEAIDNTRKKYKSAKEQMENYQTALSTLQSKLRTASGSDAQRIQEDIDNISDYLKASKDEIAGLRDFASYLGISLDSTKTTGSNTAALQKEYSLINEIYKRYTDLKKSMSDSAAKGQISDLYGNLTKIDFLSPETLKKRLSQLQAKAKAAGDDSLSLKIGLAIQDVDLQALKNQLSKKLESISQSITRSKTGTDLFQSLLGMTGDEELSASITLALTGVDIEGNNVRKQLADQIATILADESISAEVETTFGITAMPPDGTGVDEYVANISKIIQSGSADVKKFDELIASIGDKDIKSKLESALKAYLDYDTEMLKDFFKTINKSGDEVQRKTLLRNKEGKSSSTRIALLNALKPEDVSSEEWTSWIDEYLKAVQNEYDSGVAKLDLAALKNKYVDAFADMDSASVTVLNAIISELTELLGKVPDSDFTTLKAITDLIDKARDVKIDKTPLQSFIESWEELADAVNKVTKAEQESAKAAALSKMKKSTEALNTNWGKVKTAINDVIDLAEDLADVFGVEFGEGTQDAIEGFSTGITITTTALEALAAIVLVLEAELAPLLLVALAVGAAFAAIKWFSNKEARETDAAIAKVDARLSKLESTLNRLQDIEDELLGKDWIKNQNQQIANLTSQIAQIEKKIALESMQDKGVDTDAIEEWKEAKEELLQQIRELKAGIVEEMAGTTLTEAATNFAQVWLDAYLSFADTTEAIKEEFNDMMQNMIVNSVLARVVQQKLKPLFDYIDNELYDEDGNMIGSLNTLWQMMKNVTDTLPDELKGIYENLGAWAGELRTSESSLTGIAKGVSTASEESVVTLSGYANSILYYQIQEASDISAIRAILEGKTIVSTDATKSVASGSDSLNIGQLITLQQDMLAQVILIKQDTSAIRDDIADMKDTLRSVVSVSGSRSPKTVNVSYRT